MAILDLPNGHGVTRRRLSLRYSLLSVGFFMLVGCAAFSCFRNVTDQLVSEWMQEQRLIREILASVNEQPNRITDGNGRETVVIGTAALAMMPVKRRWHMVLVRDEYLNRVVGLRIAPLPFDASAIAPALAHQVLQRASAFTHLQEVSISSTPLTKDELRIIASIRGLRRLHLANTSVVDAELGTILSKCPLEIVTLDNIQLTGEFLSFAANCHRLKSLSITSDELSSEAIERFQRARPDVEFNHGAFTLGQHTKWQHPTVTE